MGGFAVCAAGFISRYGAQADFSTCSISDVASTFEHLHGDIEM